MMQNLMAHQGMVQHNNNMLLMLCFSYMSLHRDIIAELNWNSEMEIKNE